MERHADKSPQVQADRPSFGRSASAPAALIYVVDDESLMVEFLESALVGEGYQLRKFTNPVHAFAAFEAEHPKPTLLLTDYAMSPWNGLELCVKCKAAHPELKILMLSGTVTDKIALGSDVRLDGFIAKPYQPAVLAQKVRSLLDE